LFDSRHREFESKKRVSQIGVSRHGADRQTEAQAMAALLGPFMVLIFCLSQAFRDVYFANVFQGLDFFAVIAIAFGLSAIIFGLLTAARSPGDFAKLRKHVRTAVAMNVTTALAWTCYFFGLKHLAPSIVNTVHSGMAPLTVVALAAVGIRLTKEEVVNRREYACYAGLALSLVGLWWVVLSGHSGFQGQDAESSLLGLALLLVSGSSITISLLYSKRLHDHGLSAEGVTAVRYLLSIAMATSIEIFKGWPEGMRTFTQLATISTAATVLIVLPTFALQVGVARTAPLTAQVIRALGPVCVFALEQYDRRLTHSWPTLACVIAYSIFAIVANVVHGWSCGDGSEKNESTT
jgi:drug/metabolite transporter (DMT)-like permease